MSKKLDIDKMQHAVDYAEEFFVDFVRKFAEIEDETAYKIRMLELDIWETRINGYADVIEIIKKNDAIITAKKQEIAKLKQKMAKSEQKIRK